MSLQALQASPAHLKYLNDLRRALVDNGSNMTGSEVLALTSQFLGRVMVLVMQQDVEVPPEVIAKIVWGNIEIGQNDMRRETDGKPN